MIGAMTSRSPIPDSYWVEPGALLAGPYPGSLDDRRARAKLGRLLDAGIALFLDLTENGALREYASLLAAEAAARGREAVHRRHSIHDFGVPSAPAMRAILDEIDGARLAGRVVYVHCWGGRGRTGTVVGCYLVRRGLAGPRALERIAELRAGQPNEALPSPENEQQRALVLGWAAGR